MAELPDYYKEVLGIWSEISHSSTPENVRGIKEQLIWNNRFIKIIKKRVFYKRLFEAGAIRVSDLFFGNNTLDPFQYWVDKRVKACLFFKWMSVIDTIAKEWRSLIKNCD